MEISDDKTNQEAMYEMDKTLNQIFRSRSDVRLDANGEPYAPVTSLEDILLSLNLSFNEYYDGYHLISSDEIDHFRSLLEASPDVSNINPSLIMTLLSDTIPGRLLRNDSIYVLGHTQHTDHILNEEWLSDYPLEAELSIKVRCDFGDRLDSCLRCLNGRHQCIIGGREVERDILNYIQKQSEVIKQLQAKLKSIQPLGLPSEILDVQNPDVINQRHFQSSSNSIVEQPIRSSGACTRCKTLKIRCHFEDGMNSCKRCLNGAYECIIPGRKKRRGPPKRQDLIDRIREQDEEIERLKALLAAMESIKPLSKEPVPIVQNLSIRSSLSNWQNRSNTNDDIPVMSISSRSSGSTLYAPIDSESVKDQPVLDISKAKVAEHHLESGNYPMELRTQYNDITPDLLHIDQLLKSSNSESEVAPPSASKDIANLRLQVQSYFHNILSFWLPKISQHRRRDFLDQAASKLDFSSQCTPLSILLDVALNFRNQIKTVTDAIVVSNSSDLENEDLAEFARCIETDFILIRNRLVSMLRDKETFKEFVNYKDEKAQEALDLFQDILDHPLENPPSSFRLDVLLHAAVALSRRSGKQPKCLVLTGISQHGEHAESAGGFGEVFRGEWRGRAVCLKVLKVYGTSDVDILVKELSTEAMIWRHLHHPNILPFYGSFYFNDLRTRLCLVSPWMENGNVTQYLQSNPSTDRTTLAIDIARGLVYIHAKKIIHGDMKGANILVTNSGRACIADFGQSSIVQSTAVRLTTMSSAGHGGTVRWQSPEVLNGENKTFASDMYAFACVLYEIFSGNYPFFELRYEGAVIMKVMVEGKRAQRPGSLFGLTDSIWWITELCWMQKPQERLTAPEAARLLENEANYSPVYDSEGWDIWDMSTSAQIRTSMQEISLCPTASEIKEILFRQKRLYHIERFKGNS